LRRCLAVVVLWSLVTGLTWLSSSGAPVPAPKGMKEITNSIGMKLVRIPKGTFTMGSTKEEQDEVIAQEEKKLRRKLPDTAVAYYRTEGPQHEVEITRDFYLGIHEVTQKQFKDVMGYNPSYCSSEGAGKTGVKYFYLRKPAGGKDKVKGMDTNDFPVENVSWEEAVELCRKLSDLPAETKADRKYRLPTEAEWEYACRGGASSYQTFHFGRSLSSKQANFGGHTHPGAAKGDYLNRTCEVGSYYKNRFGLFDMHGNVFEWCSDWYGADYYGKSPRRDPQGPSSGSDRVVRGGGWDSTGRYCRSAYRGRYEPAHGLIYLGFRVALIPSE
jgi:formylglycine-generating enzyme required for sulfatase activity